jgi:hypothetical protein
MVCCIATGASALCDDGYAASWTRGAPEQIQTTRIRAFYAPFYGAQSKGLAITTHRALAPFSFWQRRISRSLRQVREKGVAQ